ncbi:cell division protein FtsB [Dickeya zeae]|uniref:cell division protein FtsB n=1 Tax=Dickeya zeae TaxID=204042 RepID=UPI001F317654|nr:cell division protein FtsB [Dickeya zeae]UJR60788.1 cell division protein FtsB [Dickeya zeae]
MGKLSLLLLILLGWLQYSLWLGKNGVHDYVRVKDDVAVQQANNVKLKSRNEQLFAEIDDLNGGQEAIEERARNELGMTKPGESFYRLVADQADRRVGSSSSPAPSSPTSSTSSSMSR